MTGLLAVCRTFLSDADFDTLLGKLRGVQREWNAPSAAFLPAAKDLQTPHLREDFPLSIEPFDTTFAHSVADAKYMRPHGEKHWKQLSARVTYHPMEALASHVGRSYDREQEILRNLVEQRHFIPGGRYLYATGNDFHQTQNCLLLKCEDTREGWAQISWQAEMALLTGAGIGVYWGELRGEGAPVRRTGGKASGPIPKMVATNELGRAAVQGGNRRSAIWAGLLWSHPDCEKFIRAKDWPEWLREQKALDPAVPAPLDMTNISVCLDDEFFAAYHDETHPRHALAHRIYWKTVDKMVTTGEPGFSIDIGEREDEKLRNACTEIVSADDSDVCNLGGLVLSRFDSPQEFGEAVRHAVLYLTAGTVYSDLPYDKVAEVRDKNRRLGCDLMGVHEFLLMRGLKYGSDDALEALEPYMEEYERALEYAHEWQNDAGLSLSVAATAGSPTGTRGIVAESTTSWQSVTAAAYKRVVRHSHGAGERRQIHYVVDPTVHRLVRRGLLHPSDPVEDSYSLAEDPECVLRMQAFAQKYTDQAISMTINLPHPLRDPQEQVNLGETLIDYLPRLRGITMYPNGARAGQPITPCSVEEALSHGDVAVWEDEDKCAAGVCGI